MANRFWVGQSGGGNYNSTDWATTSGGTTGQLAPTSSDDVKFDGAGTFGNTNCTITAAANALTVIFSSGYTATLTINATFTWTVAGSFTDHANHTWTVNSTDVGALTISAASTITSGGKTFPGNVTFSGTNIKTLSGNWTITGILTFTGNTTLNFTTAETLSCAGLTYSTQQTTDGTAKIILTGGTWSGNAINGPRNNLDLQGNITFGSALSFITTKTLKYVSGTITTAGSTITISSVSTILDTNGMTFANISCTGSVTLSLTSNLTLSGTFTCSGATTFSGAGGFTIPTFTCTHTTTSTITFANTTPIYNITVALNAFRTSFGSILTFTSNDGTLKAILNIKWGATCNVIGNFTRIDASGGRPILSFNGTITTCTNVFSFSDVQVPPELPEMKQRGGRRKWPLNRTKTVIYQ